MVFYKKYKTCNSFFSKKHFVKPVLTQEIQQFSPGPPDREDLVGNLVVNLAFRLRLFIFRKSPFFLFNLVGSVQGDLSGRTLSYWAIVKFGLFL
jgi:hypothetical protein